MVIKFLCTWQFLGNDLSWSRTRHMWSTLWWTLLFLMQFRPGYARPFCLDSIKKNCYIVVALRLPSNLFPSEELSFSWQISARSVRCVELFFFYNSTWWVVINYNAKCVYVSREGRYNEFLDEIILIHIDISNECNGTVVRARKYGQKAP